MLTGATSVPKPGAGPRGMGLVLDSEGPRDRSSSEPEGPALWREEAHYSGADPGCSIAA